MATVSTISTVPRGSSVLEEAEERGAHDDEEDRLDAEDARVALAEFRASGEKSIPLDEVLAGYGLTRADLHG